MIRLITECNTKHCLYYYAKKNAIFNVCNQFRLTTMLSLILRSYLHIFTKRSVLLIMQAIAFSTISKQYNKKSGYFSALCRYI